MKIKNKKILTRLSAVLATCLLLVAFAVPCFADETQPTQYVLQEFTADNYADIYAFVSENFNFIFRAVISTGGMDFVLTPALITNAESEPSYVFTTYGLIGTQSGSAINTGVSFVFDEVGVLLCVIQGAVNSDVLVDNDYIPGEYMDFTDATMIVFVPAELTPAPVDPDAPTRTGLYGELYFIIRDAIYGENALLDSTQEFTLTQIATWMTYIVILLPLVVIAIILFKIFVR